MAPLDNASPSEPLQDPFLARYSERQLAVANTWATHFSLAGTARTKFIRHYLRSTSTTRCWCITVAADNGVRYTIMRAGPLLQVFDGQLIGAWECKPTHRIPASTPSPAGALKLLQRLEKFDDAVAVLSSYTKRAHDLATQMARVDLGLQRRLVYPSHSNKRYYAPRRQFYLKQIGAVLRTFRQAVDQNLLFAIRSVRCLSPQLYNWLAQGDQRRRLQMLKAQPILTPLLVDCEEGVWPHTTTNDNGESIRHFLPCPFSLLDSERPQATTMPCDWYLDMGRILGQTAFYAAYNAIPWQIHNAKPDYNRLFNGCPSDWQDPAWLAITARLRDIKEFYTALDQGNSQVVRQARSALKAYLGHCTYRQAGNLVDDYHQVQRELRAAVQSSLPDLVDTDEYTTWEGMLPVGLVDCPNGLQIVELRCPADLYAEHVALAHCIDSYDQAAYRGDCRLLSVREASRPLASAELELRREHGEPIGRPWSPKHLSTVQLREFDNAPVPTDSPAGQAYRWFMERIRSGAIATNLNWPDMTVHMTRFANGRWKAGLAEATAKWLLTRLEDR
ncbi:hypothetical protein [Pseudomonas aeruginosa]|uniref:hypothetical protein n=1 Tax=Pseudomonas aeruginosa TaxID=287 RepID=UPI00071B8281|nr:hypothetical protein [Pseudomonas aeruginosa]KSG75750.1 hypothetical protein AO952_27940 [Pseudomonas aeruginosa]KSH62053.1 hypothetical protein AO973_27190 [Pseudomonas aeruginosa]MCD2900453.1 hypothetical protein [Pseudomonas aeruginosa]PUA06437.1 hypothetical protein DB390_32560 [Pseudomonas aeruginosa]RUG44913.1 hypothetical protein IPC755_18350 [Pseudomonas aeruginosa]